MFSNSVELILSIAYREATARRHTHLTLEHLLYVLAHDAEGEKILNACGADLPALRSELNKYLSDKVEQFPHGRQQEPEQTLAFRRTLQTAVLHVQSASRPEVQAGDLLAAMLQQHKSFASQLLEGQGVTRLDILNFISHGISKVPPISSDRSASSTNGDGDAPSGQGEEGKAAARDPLVAYTINLSARAAAGELDPLIGRFTELQRTMEVLCRRRKNNPVFVGEAGVGKTALAEGLAQRLLQDDVPSVLKGAEVFSLDTTALLAGTRFRGDFEERFKAVVAALAKRAKPILFIDEVHSTVGAGATTGGTMDLATLIKPVLTAGELRVVGSTTFEEFKQIEKDRGLARRLQKIAVDEPSVDETVRILKGLRSRYEQHHNVTYTDAALDGAARLAARHLRDSRLPDSAIDILDEAGAMLRLQPEAPAPPPAEGVHVPVVGVEKAGADTPVEGAAEAGRPRRDREGRRPHRPHPREAGVVVGQGAPQGPRGLAQPRRVRPGRRREDGRHVDQARPRRARPAGQAGRLLPVHRPDRRRQDRARQAAGAAPRQRVHALRHVGVHGEARRRPADRRAARLRRLRAGRPAGRRDPPAPLQRAAARRDREGAPRHLQHPAAGDGPRHPDGQQRPQGRLPPGGADHDQQRRLARDERRHHGLRHVRHRRRRQEDRQEPRQGSDRAPVLARVPQPPRRHRHLQPSELRGDGDDRREVHPAARGAARRTPRRVRPRTGRARVAGEEGLRPDTSARVRWRGWCRPRSGIR